MPIDELLPMQNNLPSSPQQLLGISMAVVANCPKSATSQVGSVSHMKKHWLEQGSLIGGSRDDALSAISLRNHILMKIGSALMEWGGMGRRQVRHGVKCT